MQLPTLFTFVVTLLTCVATFAQDIHLSHIHASPTVLNPAMTGLFDGDIRATANAKSQWNMVTNGYKTVVGSIDMKLTGLGSRDFLSGGIQLYSDMAGDLNFTTQSIGLALSYLRALDKRGRTFVSFGMQNNYVNNRVDFSKAETYGYIDALNNPELNSNVNYWDFSAGVGFFKQISRFNSYYIGVSAFHLNNPIVSFDNNIDQQDVLYRRFNVHGGANFKMSKNLDLKPNFVFMDQGPHREITLGSFARYRTMMKGRKKTDTYVYLGAWVRWYAENDIAGTDAIITSVRFDYQDWQITFSYDVNLSEWTSASRGMGGPELSVVKIFKLDKTYHKRTKVKCPIM